MKFCCIAVFRVAGTLVAQTYFELRSGVRLRNDFVVALQGDMSFLANSWYSGCGKVSSPGSANLVFQSGSIGDFNVACDVFITNLLVNNGATIVSSAEGVVL